VLTQQVIWSPTVAIFQPSALLKPWWLFLLIALSSCTTETIHMRNPVTGQVAECGGHPLAFPIYATIASTHDAECVRDYKEQGFVRSPTGN
jgi:hypothetical protein